MAMSVAALDGGFRTELPVVGLKDAGQKILADILSDLTCQTYRALLRSQVVHWNVAGPLSEPVRQLTEHHYTALFDAIDVVAGRVEELGFDAPTGRAALGLDKAMSLGGGLTPREMVEELVDDHEGLVRQIREGAAQADAYQDFATYDLLMAQLGLHENAVRSLRTIIAE